VRPGLLIETGTNHGGSSWFYAQLFDLMDHSRIVTIDVERMHDMSHPRVEYLIGSSTGPEAVARVQAVAHPDTAGALLLGPVACLRSRWIALSRKLRAFP
jgi:cephalosporin hydroxylase